MIKIRLVAALCLGALPSVASSAIRISGRVVDSTNRALPRATVSLISAAASSVPLRVLADNVGLFAFTSVPPGAYTLRFDSPGFLSRRVALNKVMSDRDIDLGSIMLPIGEITEGPVGPVERPKKEKPVTVCETLANPGKFSGKPVAIVGKIECGASLVDRVCFLVEDRCEQPIRADGYAWPSKVLIVDYWEEGMQIPPSTMPETDRATLRKKLALVAKTTMLGLHREPRFKTEGRNIVFSHFVDVNDDWGIAYGLFSAAPRLRKDACGEELGCGGFVEAPVALITLPNALHPIPTSKNVTSK